MEDCGGGGSSRSFFKRRDQLLVMEHQVRKWWEESHVFESEAKDEPSGEKFFGSFPIPYINGYLHLDHAFSLSKVEFAAAYHRLKGANVLLPFGFHCTGLRIQASADKLAKEIETFGNPPCFPSADAEEETSSSFQWEVMRGYGLSDDAIAAFQDPVEWLRFFLPLAIEDLKAFGLGADWRRSFVTSSINPFFDTFVKWQMRKLKALGKIVKDLRYTIYSPLDGQPCPDIYRASGEGVIPQEYTLVKMEVVVPPFPDANNKLSSLLLQLQGSNKKLYLAAATLRPETLYGQTNVWVKSDGEYGAFEINESEVFVLTPRAARNLAYQGLSRVPKKPTCLLELTGLDLIGLPLRAPLSFYQTIYCLPVLSVITNKGTGILTSVPSDSPHDYMALQVVPFGVIPIINHPEFGDKSAEKICSDMKIKSQNERGKLNAAKDLMCKRGFWEGTMIDGEFAGRHVQEARSLIRSKILQLGQAVVYSEPEKRVVSISGDECVVALTDQWYLTYGESSWRGTAGECLANMRSGESETLYGMLEHSLNWLNQWPCSTSVGLGTRIPWDEEFLVEPLSDSTIYMAYYTVCHLLQNGELFGGGGATVKPEQLTDDVWEYLFLEGPEPKSSDISLGLLKKMRKEFEYWYPFDLHVSGKDLIQKHLTFCMYNHAAIFPKKHWPRGFRCNGRMMLNSKKISKSMTLRQAIEEFSADATRFCLADAGNDDDDANFVFETANAAILRLTKEKAWMEQVVAAGESSSFRVGPPSTFADRVFANEINFAIETTEKNYQGYMFRGALKSGFYDLQAARDEYRFLCGSSGGGMNRDLLWRFMDVQTRLLAPICPHYSEYVWKKLLKKQGFVIKAGWPQADNHTDFTLQKASRYLQDSISNFRKLIISSSKKGGNNTPPRNKPMTGLIFVSKQYDGWKRECLNILRDKFDTQNNMFAPDQEILQALQQIGQELKLCMPFIRLKKDQVRTHGVEALELKLSFCEIELLQQNLDLIKTRLGLQHVEICSATDPDAAIKAGPHVSQLKQTPPAPGSPTFIFFTN
ncbi:leucine--tRNA ligase, cytoplasmic [Tanacetum coccineum]